MKYPRMRKVKATTPDKVRGKLVKYRKGDCLSVSFGGKYLAVLVSEKFRTWYDFVLLEYCKESPPIIEDFINGRFFGTRGGSWEDLSYHVDRLMIDCKAADKESNIEVVGKVDLIPDLGPATERPIQNIQDLKDFYLEEISIRIEKTINAEKFPEIAFFSRHLVEMKYIIQTPPEISN